jgi:hypothetical protein
MAKQTLKHQPRGSNPRSPGKAPGCGPCAVPTDLGGLLAGCPEWTDGRANNVSKRVASPSPSEEEQPNADSTLRASRAFPHPSADRALRRVSSEVRRDPARSTRHGRQRQRLHTQAFAPQAPTTTNETRTRWDCLGSSRTRAKAVWA